MLEIHNYDPFSYAGGKPSKLDWGSAADRAVSETWVGEWVSGWVTDEWLSG
jgi:hypothetical protein